MLTVYRIVSKNRLTLRDVEILQLSSTFEGNSFPRHCSSLYAISLKVFCLGENLYPSLTKQIAQVFGKKESGRPGWPLEKDDIRRKC